MQAFQKTPNFQQIWPLKKKIIGGSLLTGGVAGIRAVVFLVPPILVKLVFLDSVRTKLSETDPLS